MYAATLSSATIAFVAASLPPTATNHVCDPDDLAEKLRLWRKLCQHPWFTYTYMVMALYTRFTYVLTYLQHLTLNSVDGKPAGPFHEAWTEWRSRHKLVGCWTSAAWNFHQRRSAQTGHRHSDPQRTPTVSPANTSMLLLLERKKTTPVTDQCCRMIQSPSPRLKAIFEVNLGKPVPPKN